MAPYPNLLPRAMLAARSRRRRIRQWIGVLAIESALAAGACMTLLSDHADPTSGVKSTIQSTVRQIDAVTTALSGARRELQEVQQKLAVAREVARKPDWSIVLAAVAWEGQGLATLTSSQLLPAAPDPESGVSSYRVSLVGVCASQPDLTRFVHALDGTGIFSRIKVLETQRVAGPGEGRATFVGFTLEAWLVEGGG